MRAGMIHSMGMPALPDILIFLRNLISQLMYSFELFLYPPSFPRTTAMNKKPPNQPCVKIFNRRGWGVSSIIISLCVTSFFLAGCAGKAMVPDAARIPAQDTNNIFYQMTEQEALALAQWALEQTLPDQKIHRLKKPRVGFFIHEHEQKGNYKYARFRDKTFIYEVDLLRVSGRTAQGQRVVGYTYALKGDGDLKTGSEKLTRLSQHLEDAFERTGRRVTVSSLQPERPAPPVISPVTPPAADTTSTAAPSEKTGAKETPGAVAPMTTVKEPPTVETEDDVFVMLKKLKELFDQGVITEKEFKAKKKELLDRL
jgi:hypothetical protein